MASSWQCALCGAFNPADAEVCSNCGAVAPFVQRAPSGSQSSVRSDQATIAEATQQVALPVAPVAAGSAAVPMSPKVSTPKLAGRLAVHTGVVSVTERDTRKHTERQSVYGQGGRVVATHNVDTFVHRVRFRVIVQDETGRPAQVPVEVGIDQTLLFLQEGDLVTVVGRPRADGGLSDPAILNHAGRFVVVPSRWSTTRKFLTFLLLVIAATIFSVTRGAVPASDNLIMAAIHAVSLLVVLICLLSFVLLRRRSKMLKRATRTLAAGFGEGWQRRRYANPSGTVEGVFAFTRGQQNPVEWASFRLALPDANGGVGDWIVAAAPQSSITTDLRPGDQVSLKGVMYTGSIQRPGSVTLATG